MKRFLLWQSEDYYPDGARIDFVGDFDTLEEAEDYERNLKIRSGFYDILDTKTGKWE